MPDLTLTMTDHRAEAEALLAARRRHGQPGDADLLAHALLAVEAAIDWQTSITQARLELDQEYMRLWKGLYADDLPSTDGEGETDA